MTLATGQILLNRYRVEAQLGKGGMGAVYRATDLVFQRLCAVKELVPPPGTLPLEVAQLRQQFRQEASVLANLTHPGLPRVSDCFAWGSSEYLVMDYVQGQSLEDRVTAAGGRGLPEAQVLAWADQLLAALAYCHGLGIIHRDVKPANIIVTPQNQAMLVDFGLVKLWDPHNPQTMTIVRGMGTVDYAPPEQFATGTTHTDARSDLYSVGATLFHALTGRAPASAPQRFANPGSFIAPRSINPAISAGTEAVILRALALDQAQRFQSAADMRAALAGRTPTAVVVPARPSLTPTVRPIPAPTLTPTARPAPAPPRARGLPWFAGGAVLLVIAIVLLARSRDRDGGGPTTAPPLPTQPSVITSIPAGDPSPAPTRSVEPPPTEPLSTAAPPTERPPTAAPPTESPPTEALPPEPPSRAEMEADLLRRVTWRSANGEPVFAYHAGSPRIDGVIEGGEWPGSAHSVDTIVSKPENTSGAGDLSGWFYVAWDAGYLYLAVHVRDDVHVNTAAGKFLYKGDDVEVQADLDLLGDYTSTELTDDDGQVGLSVPDLAGAYDAYVWRPPENEGVPSLLMKAVPTGDGYSLEAALPWSELGLDPALETPYGFCVSIGDDDTPGSAAQESMVSNCPMRKWGDPTTWGTLIVVDW